MVTRLARPRNPHISASSPTKRSAMQKHLYLNEGPQRGACSVAIVVAQITASRSVSANEPLHRKTRHSCST